MTQDTSDDGSVSARELERAAASAFFRRVGRGYRALTPEQRKLYGQLSAKPGWAIRRQRYGPSGQRAQNYAQWLKDRGKSLPDDLKV